MKNSPPKTDSLPLRLAEARVRRVVFSATPAAEASSARPEEAWASDCHAQREMLFVLEGRSRFLYRDRVWNLAPGTLVAIDAWEVHAFGYHAEDDGLLHLWLGLHPPRMTCALLQVERGRYRSAAHLNPLAGSAFDFLSRQWDEAMAEDRAPALRSALLAGVAETAMHAAALGEGQRRTPADAANGLVDFIADFIARQHGRDCSLSRIERVTGYSRVYLAHLCRQARGKTIGEAITEARRRFVEEAMAQGLKQRTISEALGFSSPSAFCLWKRRQGRPIPQRLQSPRSLLPETMAAKKPLPSTTGSSCPS